MILTRTFAISAFLVGSARLAFAAPTPRLCGPLSCMRSVEDTVVAREPEVARELVERTEIARELDVRLEGLNLAREALQERSILDAVVKRTPQPEVENVLKRSLLEQD